MSRAVSPLDQPPSLRRGRPVVAVAVAIVVHGVLFSFTSKSEAVARAPMAPPVVTEFFEVELPEPTPVEEVAPDVAVEVAPARPERQAAARPRSARSAEPEAEPEAQPELATAAPVLAAPPAPVVNFAVPAGPSTAFAGGVTAAHGSSERAVRSAGARGAGNGGGDAAPSVDRSRPPQLGGGARWDACGFPEEADELGLNSAVVTLAVQVAADGRLESVRAVEDPGNGFGRLAVRCAQRSRWSPALDRAGEPVAATHRLRVRFVR